MISSSLSLSHELSEKVQAIKPKAEIVLFLILIFLIF